MRREIARACRLAVAAVVLLASDDAAQGVSPAAVTPQNLGARLGALRAGPDSALIPATTAFTFGDRTVAAGSVVTGPLAVASGTLHVLGTVRGDAFVYGGDLIVLEGGAVLGDALAADGKVRLAGGRVSGDVRSLGGDLNGTGRADAADASSAAARTGGQLLLFSGWLGVLIIVGMGVLVLASGNLDASADMIERDFGRALLAGIAGQLALLPVLAVLCVGLALTVLGVLLIPFAIVAYVLAAAGLLTLGFLAVARVTGRSLLGDSAGSERARRAAAVRALIVGLVVMMVPWLASAALAWAPTLNLLARIIAIAVTWVAASAGLGAALLSRGGVKRMMAPATQKAMASAGWATPTPVSGVVAARRPSTTTVPK